MLFGNCWIFPTFVFNCLHDVLPLFTVFCQDAAIVSDLSALSLIEVMHDKILAKRMNDVSYNGKFFITLTLFLLFSILP